MKNKIIQSTFILRFENFPEDRSFEELFFDLDNSFSSESEVTV